MAKFPKIIYVCPLSIWKRKNIDITMLKLPKILHITHNENDSEVDKIIKTTSDLFCLPQNYIDENVGNDKDKVKYEEENVENEKWRVENDKEEDVENKEEENLEDEREEKVENKEEEENVENNEEEENVENEEIRVKMKKRTSKMKNIQTTTECYICIDFVFKIA